LMADPRFEHIEKRRENAPALVEELDRVFATKTMSEWGEILDRHNVWWALVNSINEVVTDPAAQSAGAFVQVPGPDGTTPMVATPADFSGTPSQPQGLAPELGQHTEEVLLELGYDWDRIVALKENGAIP
ncbi:hypothetical protein LCGC14_2614550, partial [marine sediment metagenome]